MTRPLPNPRYMSDPEKSAAEAIWGWAITQGQVPEVYGRVDDVRTEKVRRHMSDCTVDVTRSETPDFGFTSEFVGTFSGNNERPAILGKLVCACGKVNDQWAVVNADGIRPTMTEIILGIIS